MEPTKQQMQGRMIIVTNEDGAEEFRFMNAGGWRKVHGSNRRHNWREANPAEIKRWEKRNTVQEEPEVEEEPEIEVPEESPVVIKQAEEAKGIEIPDDISDSPVFKTLEDKISEIKTMNQMEEFMILELDYEEDMDRTKPLDELKDMAREMCKNKE